MTRMVRRARGRRGAVLPYVLIVGVAVLVLGASIFTAANASSALSRSSVASRQAYLNAKSGIEYTKGIIAKRAQNTGALGSTTSVTFYIMGVVNDTGNAQFSASSSKPTTTDFPIYSVCEADYLGSGSWSVRVESVGRGNAAAIQRGDKVEQRIVFTTQVDIEGGVDPGTGTGVPLDNLGAGTGFDPTIMVHDGAPYTTPIAPDGSHTLISSAPQTEYSILFQTPIKAPASNAGLIAEKLYFAYKGTAPSLMLEAASNVSLKTDYVYVAGDLVAKTNGVSTGKIVLTPKTKSRTIVYMAAGSRIRLLNTNGSSTTLKTFSEAAVYEVPPGRDFIASINGAGGTPTLPPLESGNTTFESEYLYIDATVRNFGQTGAPPLGSFVSGITSGWVGAQDTLMSTGGPTDRTGKTVCWYSTGGSGAPWTSATAGSYTADAARIIWNSADSLAVPSGETSFTVAADLISFNIRSKSISPADPAASFVVRTKSGAGDVALYVTTQLAITQADGTSLHLLPGWNSIKSGTDLFRIRENDYTFDAFVVDNNRFAAVVTNSGNGPLVFTATEGVRFNGQITVPKNKQLTVKGTDFLFTDGTIDHLDQGNQKQTFILQTPTGLGNVIVSFDRDTTIQQAKKFKAPVTFYAGTYVFASGVDLLNYDIVTHPPVEYDPSVPEAGAFDFTFSDSVFR